MDIKDLYRAFLKKVEEPALARIQFVERVALLEALGAFRQQVFDYVLTFWTSFGDADTTQGFLLRAKTILPTWYSQHETAEWTIIIRRTGDQFALEVITSDPTRPRRDLYDLLELPIDPTHQLRAYYIRQEI